MSHLGTLQAGSRHDLHVGISPDAPDEKFYLRTRPKAPSATPTLMKHHLVMMGPECGSYCSCQAACCVVPIVTIRIPGI